LDPFAGGNPGNTVRIAETVKVSIGSESIISALTVEISTSCINYALDSRKVLERDRIPGEDELKKSGAMRRTDCSSTSMRE
jgi:hypothetical protein